jgi:hypothetical protein
VSFLLFLLQLPLLLLLLYIMKSISGNDSIRVVACDVSRVMALGQFFGDGAVEHCKLHNEVMKVAQ